MEDSEEAQWEAAVPDRTKYSPLSCLLECDMGTASKFIHIWPYTDMNQRSDVRKQTVEAGIWPPSRHPNAPKFEGPSAILVQENKILLPAPFSPMQ